MGIAIKKEDRKLMSFLISIWLLFVIYVFYVASYNSIGRVGPSAEENLISLYNLVMSIAKGAIVMIVLHVFAFTRWYYTRK